jgi:hypothetical protein
MIIRFKEERKLCIPFTTRCFSTMLNFLEKTKEYKMSDTDAFIDSRVSGFGMLNKWRSQPKHISPKSHALNLVDFTNP